MVRIRSPRHKTKGCKSVIWLLAKPDKSVTPLGIVMLVNLLPENPDKFVTLLGILTLVIWLLSNPANVVTLSGILTVSSEVQL